MDNDLAPSLQVRMDSISPVISLNSQQLREKEQQLGILPPSPGIASSSTLHSEVNTVPTSQQDDSANLSVFPHISLCSPVTSLGDTVVQRVSVPLAAETSVALPQSDATHLLNKILMQPSSSQTLPQAPSDSLNQQAQPVQQPQQQQQSALLASTHTPQPQLLSIPQRDPPLASGPVLAIAQPTRVLHQAGQILPQTTIANTLGLGASSERGSSRVVTIDGTIDDSPTSNDSAGSRSSPTGDLFQGGVVPGRKRQSFSKTPSSGRNQGFVIPTVSFLFSYMDVCITLF